MLTTIDKIEKLFATISTAAITAIDKLPQAGSERHYYRLNHDTIRAIESARIRSEA